MSAMMFFVFSVIILFDIKYEPYNFINVIDSSKSNVLKVLFFSYTNCSHIATCIFLYHWNIQSIYFII